MSDELSKEELLRINLELVKQNNRLSHENKIQKQTIEEYKKSNRDLVVSSQQIIRQGRAAQSKSQMAQEMLRHEEKKSEKFATENKKLIHDMAKQHKTQSGRIIDLEQMLNLHLVDSMTYLMEPDEKSKKITALMKELAEKENQLELEKQKSEKEVKEKEELKRRLDAVKSAIGMDNGSDASSSCFESEFSLP
ncbi:Oidioi.mRNA.OKI2018_I69.chr1.g939.t1.cds [Oikopleura dioica]|uniref:Oidioi.mRNA.OKI2018_I69.chr1.g939.t1.cds n=1 Tax=Oikopleura dioica TaxID=34765 RepID=A0ABN7SRM6_OIKDI|nr:Oidioi.mRNA.OKI2018_I69.chr1.g939.t1.cds [Oikopleura dioica]